MLDIGALDRIRSGDIEVVPGIKSSVSSRSPGTSSRGPAARVRARPPHRRPQHKRLLRRSPASAAPAPGSLHTCSRTSLVYLDLRSKRLSDGVLPLPGTLVYLSSRLSDRVGGVLRRLPRLVFLDLGGNWLSSEVPREVFAFRIGYLQLFKTCIYSRYCIFFSEPPEPAAG